MSDELKYYDDLFKQHYEYNDEMFEINGNENSIKEREKDLKYYQDLIDANLDIHLKDNYKKDLDKTKEADLEYYKLVKYLVIRNGHTKRSFKGKEPRDKDIWKHHIHENIVPNLGSKKIKESLFETKFHE
ncbi:hypothetical protein [Lactobacillus sp. Sy-1]|uniref:hypothetical protein n=1 Tax=Lactobacillus sp. Sy-1 TaxID=2109645 RepID=UPI001C5B1E87|nr:hypothetical protein [Lactobacillus sp. Sy-1]MBW1606330.1 hypothetical protein [Lactobacillus sp. Sy-1]